MASPVNPSPGEMLKPVALRSGDLVAVVAPAGPVRERALTGGIRVLENQGLRVRVGRHVGERRGYLAGPDEARAEDLNEALTDPDVRAVFCARGGYGCGRVLGLVDFAAPRADPKVFVGYSDVTALHLAFAREAGLVTFHGPGVESLGEKLTRFTLDCLMKAVTLTEPLDVLPVPDDYPVPRVVSAGRASGPLAGGNLSLVASLLGTPYALEARGRVLLLEDVGEQPYRVDRMLTQLALSGKLSQAAGIVLGEMVDCEAPKPEDAPGLDPGEPPASLSLDDVVADHLSGLGIPVLSGLPCGHGRDKWTVPLGLATTVDGYRARVIVEEAACGER